MNIVQTFLDMALLGSTWVLWLLVALSILSIAIILERIVFFNKVKLDFAKFCDELGNMLSQKKYEVAETLCKNNKSFEAKVALKGIEEHSLNDSKAIEENMRSYLMANKQQLDKGLVVLGTLGNNAPFIGLFGTVLGVIQAFHDLGSNPAGGAGVVMAGISEALVATAVGLMVAIPAVIAFNFFQRIVKRHLSNGEALIQMISAKFSN